MYDDDIDPYEDEDDGASEEDEWTVSVFRANYCQCWMSLHVNACVYLCVDRL